MIMSRRDSSVSEIVGTMLVFAIMVSAVSTFEIWYIPATQTPYDQQFQVNSQRALASLVSQLEDPYISSGQIISQGIPMGIQGSIITPSIQSQVCFSNSGFNATLSYQVGLNYKLLENTVPTAISNKVVGSFPTINGRVPTSAAYDPLNGNLYVTDYSANAVSVINLTTGKVLGEYYVGMNPYGITYAQGYLYITNFFRFYSASLADGYSTISVFNPQTHSIAYTIDSKGNNGNLLYPSNIICVNGELYVADVYNHGTKYLPQLVSISLSNYNSINVAFQFSDTTKAANNTGTANPPPSALLETSSGGYTYIWMTEYYQSDLTLLNLSSPAIPVYFNAGNGKTYVNHPFALTSASGNVYVTNSYGLLYNHPVPNHHPNHGRHKGNKHALVGNLSVFSCIVPSTGAPPFIVNISIPTGTPAALSPGPLTESNPNVYVGGYNQSYNTSGQFLYSDIVALNSTNVSNSLTSSPFNASGSYNMGGESGFMSGPVDMLYIPLSVFKGGGALVVIDNQSNNIAILSNLTGHINAEYIWNSPFNSPSSEAYDSSLNEIAVANAFSDNIAMINPVTQSVVSQLQVGGNVTSVAYDGLNGFLYAANNGTNNVTVVSPTLGKSVANVSIPSVGGVVPRPNFAAVDPLNGTVYVLATNTSSIFEINGTILSTNVISLPANTGPISGAFTPNGTLFVSGFLSNSVMEVNLTRGVVVQTFHVGNEPEAVSYDPASNTLFIANSGSHNVSTISLNSLNVGGFSVGSTANPSGLAFDQGNGYLYISNDGSNNVTLNNTFTGYTISNIATGLSPSSILYDPEDGLIYVADQVSNQVTVINGGSIYFNNNTGKYISNSLEGSGQFVSYGNTAYVPSVAFHVQDNMVLSNYSSSKFVVSSANIPVSVANNSGNVSVSAFLINLVGPDSSTTGTGTSAIVLNLSKVVKDQYYLGERFTYYDLYGNGYPAMITGLYLFGLTYTIHSQYTQEINSLLYKQYNSTNLNTPMSWHFHNEPFAVDATNTTITIHSYKVITAFSVSIEYLDADVEEV